MTFIGTDGSLVDWEDNNDIKVYYGHANSGVYFRDIAYSPQISLYENMYICGLTDSKIDALNCFMVFAKVHYVKERLLEYKALEEDMAILRELRANLSMLSHYISIGNVCDYRILSQAQKHANSLEESIEERRQEMKRVVTNSN